MRVPSTVQDLLLTALPAGGQRTARRNAWAGMSTNAARARARREAAEALAAQRAGSAGSSPDVAEQERPAPRQATPAR